MTTDVTNVQNAYQMILRIAVRAPLMMICSMVMCFIINPTLSFIFLGALILLGFVLFFIIYKVTPIFTEGFAKYDDLNASVQENVTGIRVVKAFVREDHENKKFSRAAGKLYKIFVKAESWLAFNNPIMMFVIYGSIIALSWFAAHFITDGTMTTGNLTSMFSYVMSMMMSLMMLSMIFVMVSMSAASARRIAEVLNEKADITNPENPVMEVSDGRIDFRELVKDLAAVFKTRIELRQIGVRDETKILGGIGSCGRPLCCATFLPEFNPVSIKMAKEQNLSLNPTKISGVCGRLMCCLKNEQDTYEELNSHLPNVGDSVTTPDKLVGEVSSVNVLRQRVKVLITHDNDEKELKEYPVEELRFKRKRRFDKVRIDDDKELKALEELERKEGKAHISDD